MARRVVRFHGTRDLSIRSPRLGSADLARMVSPVRSVFRALTLDALLASPPRLPAVLSDVDDGRRFDPTIARSQRTLRPRGLPQEAARVIVWSGSRPTLKSRQAAMKKLQARARSKVGVAPVSLAVPAKVGFRAAARVVVCLRRDARKRVIHAKGVAGGRVRPPRRGPMSEVVC